VATVARVATVAVPGAATARPVAPAAAPREHEGHEKEGSGEPAPDAALGRFASLGTSSPTPPLEAKVETPRPTLGAAAMDRVARVLELQDAQAARPMTQMLLRVENAAGSVDQIRVGLRGDGVGASIDLGGRGGLDLGRRVDALQRALEGHGLQLDHLRVRTTGGAEGAAGVQVAAALGDTEALRTQAGRSGGDAPQHRDRQPPAPRDGAQQRSSDSRNRSRREPRGEKNA
jgi:hypothetical protein